MDRVYGQNNPKYHIPLANTKLLKQDITCQWPRVWNNLKSDLKKKRKSLKFPKGIQTESSK